MTYGLQASSSNIEKSFLQFIITNLKNSSKNLSIVTG